MLVIYGEITIDPAARDQLIAAAVAMQKASQTEAGCHRYVFAADLERDDLFHVSEHWESQAALDAHFATPHMAAFQAALGGNVKRSTLKKYEASGDGTF